jgi:hypothetical protein
MTIRVALAAMTLAMCASPALASSAISLVTPGPEAIEAHRTLGFEFSADNAQSITALGAYDSGRDGLIGTATVGIWDLFGNLQVSAVVPTGTGGVLDGDFRFVAITPFALTVGKHYVVGSWDQFDLETNWAVGPTGGTAATNTNLSFYGDRFSNLGGGSPDFAYPDAGTGTNGARLGANFIIERTAGLAVPEPQTWALMLLGFGGLGSVLRRRRAVTA